jgi:2-polyprenyl-6-hydroxyphenyl methylase/3-demethylubiquinone-9 3-methyltransferase
VSEQHAENIDRREIDKFDALADRWWDPEGDFRPLHDINPARVEYITARVPIEGARVLDIGCGGGILAESLARRGASVSAIDMAEAPLAVAKLHQLKSGVQVDYRKATAEQEAECSPGAYDLVSCLEMLEHVPDPARVVDACARLVKPGGHVVFSTINRNPKSFLMAIVGAEYVLRILPRGTHEYEKLIRPSELCGWARQARLNVEDVVGMHYNPLTRVCKLGGNVHVNYIVYARREAEAG